MLGTPYYHLLLLSFVVIVFTNTADCKKSQPKKWGIIPTKGKYTFVSSSFYEITTPLFSTFMNNNRPELLSIQDLFEPDENTENLLDTLSTEQLNTIQNALSKIKQRKQEQETGK